MKQREATTMSSSEKARTMQVNPSEREWDWWEEKKHPLTTGMHLKDRLWGTWNEHSQLN